MTTQKLYTSYMIATLEFHEDYLDLLKELAFKNFREDTGEEPGVYYFHFMDDDYERGMVRLTTESECRGIIVSVPEEEYDQALDKVFKMNSHLNLRIEREGVYADDFVNGRKILKTAILKIA